MVTNAPASDLPILNDPVVPAHYVLGAGASEVLAATLEAAGATMHRSKAVQSTYYPGRSLTVMHQVQATWADGRRTTEDLVLAAGRTAPAGATTISDGTNDLVVWRVPNDPWLPGLAPALDPATMAGLLAEVGPVGNQPLRCRLRAYRPGRRAVVEVTANGLRVFAKVVRPRSVESLHRAHELLAEHAPVPHSLGWSAEHGIVILQGLPGRTLREAMSSRFGLPGSAAMMAVLDSLPDLADDPEAASTHRVDWRAHEFARLLASVMPEIEERVSAVADGLESFEELAQAEPVVPVHGDFYEAQLLVDGGRITGLLDVDTYGPGRRIDDLATLVGHLAVLALGSPQQAQIERYAARLLDGFDQVVDPALLRAAVASVVLGLATGSFRVLEASWRLHTEARIALAEQWLASARAVAGVRSAERTLTAAQSGPQPRTAL